MDGIALDRINIEAAFADFMDRRAINATRTRVHNENLPAGSPMHFDCVGCNDDIVVAEDYVKKPTHCPTCTKLNEAGILKEFIKRASELEK